jgi:hypothetical protein
MAAKTATKATTKTATKKTTATKANADTTPAGDSTMPGLSGTDNAPRAPKWVGGSQKKLGEVNHAAAKKNSGDPERNEPKRSLADGVTPRVGMKVLLRSGEQTATIAECFQIAASVKLDADGKMKVVAYSKLVRQQGSSR